MRRQIAIALTMIGLTIFAAPVHAQQPPAPGQTFRDCPECPEMVALPTGEFMMGSPKDEKFRFKGEGPQRKVTIAKLIAVGKFEVTFAEWAACVGGGGCRANRRPDDRGWGKAKRPVINVSWNDARQYVTWLSAKTGKQYRLLSEAEWEYAARGGTTTVYWWSDDVGENNANCNGCKSKWDGKQTAPVGSFKPNGFGLHDMLGNVSEWVEDCYGEYAKAPSDGSSAPVTQGCTRVVRGGSWSIHGMLVRAAIRFREVPGHRNIRTGFRVGRTLAAAQ